MSENLRQMIEALRERVDTAEQSRSRQHGENHAQLARIEAAVNHNDKCVDDMKKKLFGNGQPGVIQVMQDRISDLEKTIWRASGIIAFIITMLNVVLVLQKLLQ